MSHSLTLADAPDSVFRVWRNRLNIEYEAASVFGSLGEELALIHGQGDAVVELCYQAEQEELDHARRCIEILSYSGSKPAFEYRRRKVELGPYALNPRQKILYSALAMGCVTETLSTALLTEMLHFSEEGLIRETIHHILKDEVRHSRIGWAELHRESQVQNLKWVEPWLSAMVAEALGVDIRPMLSRKEGEEDLSRWGILSPQKAKRIVTETIEKVIVPGLRHFDLNLQWSDNHRDLYPG